MNKLVQISAAPAGAMVNGSVVILFGLLDDGSLWALQTWGSWVRVTGPSGL